jgi:lipid-binding SYLF domain-containing protein
MRLLVSVFLLASSVFAAERNKTNQRLDDAATVFSEIMVARDKGIPHSLLEKAHCVVIVPGLKKGAFVVGAQYGKGFVSCR